MSITAEGKTAEGKTAEGKPAEGKPARFDGARAERYDDTIQRALPGYTVLHDVAATLLGCLLGAEARVLVIGAGTGTDILKLGAVHPGWRFVGVDPSPDMLAVAEARLADVPAVATRTVLAAGTVDDLDAAAPPFDAALCVLVTHFLPDTPEGKARLLRGAAARLRPGAPLVLGDFSAPCPDLPSPEILEAAWIAWQRGQGLAEEAIGRGLAHARRAIHPLTPLRLAALLDETGFEPPRRIMQALHVHGWMTRRRAEDRP